MRMLRGLRGVTVRADWMRNESVKGGGRCRSGSVMWRGEEITWEESDGDGNEGDLRYGGRTE